MTTATPNDDAPPTAARRMARFEELTLTPALTLHDVALLLGLPYSTIDKLRAQGRGPRTFLIGRRLYVRQKDFRDWIDRLAEEAGA